jgi:hypothetical protein
VGINLNESIYANCLPKWLVSWVWRFVPVIPATWEGGAG